MPLTVRLPCWGDLGRYEANDYGLPTLRSRFESSCKLICCVAVHLRSFDVLHSQCNQRCGPRGSSLYKGSARYTVVTVAVLKLTAIDSGPLSETARRCDKSGCLAPKIRCASLDHRTRYVKFNQVPPRVESCCRLCPLLCNTNALRPSLFRRSSLSVDRPVRHDCTHDQATHARNDTPRPTRSDALAQRACHSTVCDVARACARSRHGACMCHWA